MFAVLRTTFRRIDFKDVFETLYMACISCISIIQGRSYAYRLEETRALHHRSWLLIWLAYGMASFGMFCFGVCEIFPGIFAAQWSFLDTLMAVACLYFLMGGKNLFLQSFLLMVLMILGRIVILGSFML